MAGRPGSSAGTGVGMHGSTMAWLGTEGLNPPPTRLFRFQAFRDARSKALVGLPTQVFCGSLHHVQTQCAGLASSLVQ